MKTIQQIVNRSMNTNIYFPNGSFIAYINYDSEAKELHVTFAKGQRYKYLKISGSRFMSILNARNRGSFMVHNILTGKEEGTDFIRLDDVPVASIQKAKQDFKNYQFYAR